jgi:hypothetical protein
MPPTPLFSDGDATDQAYVNIRAAANDRMAAIRRHCEDLWEKFAGHADAEFAREIRTNFDARYWEMYLACTLMDLGFEIASPKPGPDVGITYEGQRIWFEATSPTRGLDGTADQVPVMKVRQLGEKAEAFSVPNEKLVLRYLNSISEKCLRQHPKWIAAGTVSSRDIFIVALNPKQLGWEFGDTSPPRILQAAFNIADPYIVINRDTLETIREGYHFRSSIKKEAGQPVSTGVFQNPEYKALSGLICSRVDAANQAPALGGDFQFIANPNATNLIPAKLRLRGIYYRVEKKVDEFVVVPEEDNKTEIES